MADSDTQPLLPDHKDLKIRIINKDSEIENEPSAKINAIANTQDTLSEYTGVPLDHVEEIRCYTRSQITPDPINRDKSPNLSSSAPQSNRTTPLPDIIRSSSVNPEGRRSIPLDDETRTPSTISTASQWTHDSELSASGRSMLSDSYSIDSYTMRLHKRRQRVEPTFDSLVSSMRSGHVELSTQVYAQRWYILILYSVFSFLQGSLVDVYTVIAQSAEPAFGWSNTQISLMQNWIYATYPLALFPSCWLADRKGLRATVLVGCLLLFIGTLFRCFSTQPPLVTWFAHLGNIFVGISCPAAFVMGPVLSSVWFPPYQRTTATAIAQISGFAGASAGFVLGPNVVDVPIPEDNQTSIGTGHSNYTNLNEIRQEIRYLRMGECAVVGFTMLLLLIYFPAKPPRPPSISASLEKLSLGTGMLNLFRRDNARFWLVCLTYTFSAGLYDIWSALLDVNLKQYGVSEKEAGWTACLAVFVGSLFAVVIGLLSDMLSGKMKIFSVSLVILIVISSVWLAVICMFKDDIPYFNVQLYASLILQGIGINGPIPLFIEMAIESSYPVSENVTSGMMSLAYNVFPLLFLALFWIPNIGTEWMNWFCVGSACCCLPLILAFKQRFRRSEVDDYRALLSVN